jgi:hypothetical protein
MRRKISKPEKIAEYVVACALGALVVWGMVSVVAEVRPFWVDEWRIIYNLKFKTIPELWGKLAFMQQFPRAYLSLLKVFTATFGYNYHALRLPSFVLGVLTIVIVNRLATKLYPASINRYLLVLMLLSCGTFTEYYVQIKQYTMDLFLCVAAIWQMILLLETGRDKSKSIISYVLVCLSFLVAPFFSYTYPLVVAPVYLVLLVWQIVYWRTEAPTPQKIRVILKQWFPLFLCTFSITLFYVLDVAQLSSDGEMKRYWQHLMMQQGFEISVFCRNVFHMFAQAGSGFLFWWLFGLSCTIAFVFGVYTILKNRSVVTADLQGSVLFYSFLLLLTVMVMHLAGKLPLGEPRLNAFVIPAISVLLIHFLGAMQQRVGEGKVAVVVCYILLAGLSGNIFSTIAASFTDDKYARRMEIYRSTERAVAIANDKKLPILITPGVAYPYEHTRNLPFDNTVPGDWVLMTFPAYKVNESMPVYAIADTTLIAQYKDRMPGSIAEVMAGDGINYRIVKLTN